MTNNTNKTRTSRPRRGRYYVILPRTVGAFLVYSTGRPEESFGTAVRGPFRTRAGAEYCRTHTVSTASLTVRQIENLARGENLHFAVA